MTTNRLWGVLTALAVAAVVVWWPGCRQYPPVTSKESLGLMKLLYAACNTRDEARLGKVEQGVEKLTRDGKMTPGERAGFAHVIGKARAGDWAAAEDAAFKFAQDQVGVGHPDPDPHDHPPPPKGKAKR